MLADDRRGRRARLERTSPDSVARGIVDLSDRLRVETNPIRRAILEDALEDHESVLASIELPRL